MVGGVVRSPVGESVVLAAKADAQRTQARKSKRRHEWRRGTLRASATKGRSVGSEVVDFIGAIETAYGEAFAIGGELRR